MRQSWIDGGHARRKFDVGEQSFCIVFKENYLEENCTNIMSSKSTLIHGLEQDEDIAPSPKRIKLDASLQTESVLPPSHSLLGVPLPVAPTGQPLNFTEADVGISEYVAKDIIKVEAIIKQRYIQIFHFILY